MAGTFALLVFQFHKGTIKAKKTAAFDDSSKLFQFHKGTIKADGSFFGIPGFKLFQFHKGTIKAFTS